MAGCRQWGPSAGTRLREPDSWRDEERIVTRFGLSRRGGRSGAGVRSAGSALQPQLTDASEGHDEFAGPGPAGREAQA